jgi:Glycosyltransferase 61
MTNGVEDLSVPPAPPSAANGRWEGSGPARSGGRAEVFVRRRDPAQEVIRRAVVTPGHVRPVRQYSGEAYRPDGTLCPLSLRPSARARFKHVPIPPPRRVPERLEGRYLYAGPLFGIFGHDLVELPGRLWPLMTETFDGIVVQKFRPGHDAFQLKLDRTISTVLAAFGVGFHAIKVIETPTEVEHLTVPEPALYINDYGLPILGDCFRRIADRHRSEPVFDGRGFYLSRTETESRVVNETEIEDVARQFGLQVLHPQHCPLPVQISLMGQARVIVGTDGSAMHLAAFARSGTRLLCFETRRLANQRIIGEVSALDARYVEVPPDRHVRDIRRHFRRILA